MSTMSRRLILAYVFSLVFFFALGMVIILRTNQFSAPTPSPTPEVAGVADVAELSTVPSGADSATVSAVVDGDTLKIKTEAGQTTVRLIGIDTPELHDPRKPVECYGAEAGQRLSDLVLGQTIYLLPDASQADKDKYGRLLRYIWLSDGQLVNKVLIQEGYAFEYTYDVPYVYQSDFKSAEQSARQSNRGLWSSETCNGQHVAVSNSGP